MKKAILYSIVVTLFCSCGNSKWETIQGNGIDDEPKSIDNVIYFEDENNGVVGGYTLVSDSNAQNDVKLSPTPTLYLTKDGGKNWTEIRFDSPIKQSVRKAYLHLDTLVCQTDSSIFFSKNKGGYFKILTDSTEQSLVYKQYLNNVASEISNDNFQYKGIKYTIKELYRNNLASVIVCYGPESMTNYYFVSFDKEKSWSILQKDFGDNSQKFLLADKYLYRYKFPFGLQKLSLR